MLGRGVEKNRKDYYPIGTLVTCKVEERPYSYQYMPEEKKRLFTPGKVGTVAAIPPKVSISKQTDERLDKKPYFYCVDWEENGVQYRAGINHCNLVKIK